MAFSETYTGTTGTNLKDLSGWTGNEGAHKLVVTATGTLGGQGEVGSGYGYCLVPDQGNVNNSIEVDLTRVLVNLIAHATHFVDANNWIGFWCRGTNSTGMRIVKCEAGVISTVATAGQPSVATYRLDTTVSGSTMTVELFEDDISFLGPYDIADFAGVAASTEMGSVNAGQSSGTGDGYWDNAVFDVIAAGDVTVGDTADVVVSTVDPTITVTGDVTVGDLADVLVSTVDPTIDTGAVATVYATVTIGLPMTNILGDVQDLTGLTHVRTYYKLGNGPLELPLGTDGSNQLDALPLDGGSNVITGDFDIVIPAITDTVQTDVPLYVAFVFENAGGPTGESYIPILPYLVDTGPAGESSPTITLAPINSANIVPSLTIVQPQTISLVGIDSINGFGSIVVLGGAGSGDDGPGQLITKNIRLGSIKANINVIGAL